MCIRIMVSEVQKLRTCKEHFKACGTYSIDIVLFGIFLDNHLKASKAS